MQIKNVKDMYTELQELVSMESQIDIALKRMADAASHPSLKRELLRHRGETKEQSKRLQSNPAESRREIARSHRSRRWKRC